MKTQQFFLSFYSKHGDVQSIKSRFCDVRPSL
jgi:hypothetical protein